MAKLWEMLDQAYYYIGKNCPQKPSTFWIRCYLLILKIWMPGMPISKSATHKMIWKGCATTSSTSGIRV